MPKVLIVYIFIELGVICLGIISLVFWDKRYKKNHGLNVPAGFEKTEEVSVDPKSQKRFRVYYNPSTGERFYCQEN